ncbi:MAG: DUF3566 domain-containing protein [Actinobacteria bacterium]|nr:DUF3566 domain-containing protein [Actinomycetota bacterium]MBI3687377.1 DUF3566 domain-containing protein [Actinomycetota bacterium]
MPSDINGRDYAGVDALDGDPTRAGSGVGDYDLSQIGGTATYGQPRSAEPAQPDRQASYSAPVGAAQTSYQGGNYDEPPAYAAPGYAAPAAGYAAPGYGGTAEAGAAASMYRVGRDGSVKKLGVDTEIGMAPVAAGMPDRPAPARGGPRRARLQLKHIDPWSVMKFSLVMAVALFFVWMIAVGLLYGVLSGMGVFDKVNSLYDQVHGGALLTGGFVLGSAAMIGAINIVLFSALATVGSYVYNLCADLVGGIEVTLSERD